MSQLKVGAAVDHYFVIVKLSESLTKGGKKYLSLDVRNKLIACNTKIWDWENVRANLDREPEPGGFVKITGLVEEYAGTPQIKTQGLAVVDESDVDMSHIVETAGRPLHVLENELRYHLRKIQNTVLFDLVDAVVTNTKLFQLFKTKPAATKNHHAVRHGLMEHTVSMMGLATALQSHYTFLNLDLLLAGILFHDIGKVIEINDVLKGTYSDIGRFLGHINIGTSIIDEIANSFGYRGKEEVDMLKHMVLSHHGKLEWGSPIEPRIPEAVALHMIDNMDATFYTMFRQMKDLQVGEWTSDRPQAYYKHSLSLIDSKDYYRK